MRKRTRPRSDLHADWLTQVDTDGPFLALPVVKDMWPSGVDRLGDTDDRLVTFKQAFVQWQRAFDHYTAAPKTPEAKERYDEVNRAWIEIILDQVAEWDGLRADADVSVQSPGEQITVRATSALEGRAGDRAALLLVSEPTSGLRETGLDGWAATDIDRMAMLLREAQVEVGVVTDGQWWAVVWAKDGKPTGSGMVNALTWAEEPLLRDAFFTLLNQRRFRAVDPEQRLTRLFERGELEAEEITAALGTQVRKSVELLVQAFSEARLDARRHGEPDPLTDKPDDVYQAAVTIMMRIVFLLFAEERDMLPTEQLYWNSYALKDLLDDFKAQAASGEEHLDESFDGWHRLLAVSSALFTGVNYDEMRMPAYGGSLLDPDRFPWLHATDSRGLRLKVSDRVMMHVLESVQTVVAKGERRRISFRDVDVEQIGYIYEGLLGYSCAEVEGEVVLGLVGKDGEEPEIDAASLQALYDENSLDGKAFASALIAWCKEHQPAATPHTIAKLAKLFDADVDEAELTRLLTPFASGDEELLAFLVDWGNFIRRDLRGIPLVVPIGGLVLVETPSRRNAGAHYTPRSLAEDVVLHALQPLVYEPGPLQTNDENEWKLKPAAAILDLKVADIAAGSGAFLVAAARYLAARLVEAWTAEDMLSGADIADPDELQGRALREVIARCMYGADINPMAVEMCKLSLWLVSMDKAKPFSFVDDKVFCGNSLLGLSSLDQLRYLHVYPEPTRMDRQIFVDVDAKIATSARLRRELASPVDEHDPMRSTRGKLRLLDQVRAATNELRLIADGVTAAGLPLGAKEGRQLNDAFKTLAWQLQEALPGDGSSGDNSKMLQRIDVGLTPTVETDYERWTPLHWIIEAPDVMVEHGGFDAVIGNPPFMYGRDISGASGAGMRDWYVAVVAGGTSGVADLCAYFFLRAVSLLNADGSTGLIATNTIAQGDTQRVGLQRIVQSSMIRRAVQSMKWPTRSANLEVALVWTARRRVGRPGPAVLNGESVRGISASLEPEGRVVGRPYVLAANRQVAFMGANINGVGFLMTPDEARDLIESNSQNAEVLHPYLTGDDLNSDPGQKASRWAVNFEDWPHDKILAYPGPYAWIEKHLKPHRKKLVKKPKLQQKWWVYESRAKGLRAALSGRDAVLAVSLVSKFLAPCRVPAEQVFSHKVGVFVLDDHADLAVLTSTIHESWARAYGSTLETRLNYSLTDVFGTFPRPHLTPRLAEEGERLDKERRRVMSSRKLGLTDLYNLVNDPDCAGDRDIDLLRRIQLEVDEAAIDAYGWTDLRVEHAFREYKKVVRLTVSAGLRAEILDRLLELNHERARAEGQNVAGLDRPEEQDTLFA